ncbi:hypothetical protein [Pseudomonas carnis]|uniref:hypothetical protein n=1 Tax=Pseudomonas carnis TaxID=2487355 RepID=UPI001968B6FB|nr:hypothetical protein [Pseudomonas carnis]
MTDESQVHTTSQDAESTQPDETQLDQSTSETSAEAGAVEQSTESQEGKDPNAWALKRISELTRQRHEAERKAEASTGEAARYRMLVEQLRAGGEPENTDVSQQPNIDELVEKRAAQVAQHQAIAERGQSVSKVGAEQYPDFQSAVITLDALGISQDSVESILGMDDAHKVIYALGKNPDEAARILALPPVQQGRELERLSLKAAQPAPKAVSKAPAPITPLDSSATVETDPSKMSMAEWAKWREKNSKSR